MNRNEFMEQLRVALSAELDYYTVNENIVYYEEYIDVECQKGKKESDVLNILGDPRLIAKTIIAASKLEEKEDKDVKSVYEKENTRNEIKVKKIPFWVIILIVVLITILILKLALTIIIPFIPFILIVLSISYMVKIFKKK